MEAELKPKVLETFDNIAATSAKLRKLQDEKVESKLRASSPRASSSAATAARRDIGHVKSLAQ
jgi:RNA polymerase primary sigma factor